MIQKYLGKVGNKRAFSALLFFLVTAVILIFTYFYKNKMSLEDSAQLNLIDTLENDGLSNFRPVDISGGKVFESEFSNKILILNFWASWCSPCVDELPSLISLMTDLGDSAYLVAISGDESSEELIVFLKSFPNINRKNIRIVFDQNHELMKKFKVERLPESFIFNPKGKLVKKISGSIKWNTPESLMYLRDLYFK